MSLTYSNRTTSRNEVVAKENVGPFFFLVAINETSVGVDLLLCLTFVPLCKLKAQREPTFAFGCKRCSQPVGLSNHVSITFSSRSHSGDA